LTNREVSELVAFLRDELGAGSARFEVVAQLASEWKQMWNLLKVADGHFGRAWPEDADVEWLRSELWGLFPGEEAARGGDPGF
jgi:hypothetical protein